VNYKLVFLRIKIKNLADEARLIRLEEQRYSRQPWLGTLVSHRKSVVRPEARATLLAYGYLRGKQFKQIESIKSTKRIDWTAVKRMVDKYGDWQQAKNLQDWIKESALVSTNQKGS
jgi:hypothetical protein